MKKRANKRFIEQYEEFIYRGQPIPFSLGTLCMVMFCLLLLILATFTQLNIYHPWLAFDDTGFLKTIIKQYPYTPQVPLVLLIASLLGARFGILTLALYVLVGFFIWPIFALGGGLDYIKNPVFGYILGYFPAIILTGAILHKDKSYKGVVLATFFGVISIHLCGMAYIAILSLFGLANFNFATGAIFVLSGAKIIYDWILSFALISLSHPLKSFLWLAMKNNASSKNHKIIIPPPKITK